jgi:hypothetical protein
MSETAAPNTKPENPLGEGKYPLGAFAAIALTIPLLVFVALPFGKDLLVLCAYGYDGYEQGIRVTSVPMSKRLMYTTGEQLSGAAEACYVLGSFLASAFVAVYIVALVRWSCGYLKKLPHQR